MKVRSKGPRPDLIELAPAAADGAVKTAPIEQRMAPPRTTTVNERLGLPIAEGARAQAAFPLDLSLDRPVAAVVSLSAGQRPSAAPRAGLDPEPLHSTRKASLVSAFEDQRWGLDISGKSKAIIAQWLVANFSTGGDGVPSRADAKAAALILRDARKETHPVVHQGLDIMDEYLSNYAGPDGALQVTSRALLAHALKGL